jgi:hypothetical protein
MTTAAPTLPRTDLFQIADQLSAAISIIHRQRRAKTTLDVYLVSVFSTLHRSVLRQARESEEIPAEAGLAR